MLEDELVTTLDAAKKSDVMIEKSIEESTVDFSSSM